MRKAMIVACMAWGLHANAQTTMTPSGTITNAATGYVASKVPGGYGNLSIQVVVTKTSGTVAGKVTLEASNDGVNYRRIMPTDSLNLTDVATQSVLFNVGTSPYLYYRGNVTTTGTQVSTGTGTYVFRVHP
jgi:hypothetical protein